MRIRISLLTIILSIAMYFTGSAAANAQDTINPTFESAECMFEGLELGLVTLTGEQLGFECGYVTVPENHAIPDGTTIRLPVAIHRATGPNPSPDALFLAQGGPGGDAFGIYTILAPSSPMAEDRDIVIFNQRGTKYAEPDLTCDETFEVTGEVLVAEDKEAERLYTQALADCYRRLSAEGIDLSSYNSLQNAADIPAIAQALGYDAFNFYGVSYGTLLGLHLMNLQPASLRSVILDSVVPTDINFIAEAAASENRAYNEIFSVCSADPDCARDYPNLEERYFNIMDQLDENPVLLSLTDPDSGESFDATLNGSSLRSIIFQLFYLPDMAAVFPKIVADLENGDYRYIESMWPLFEFDQSISEGMYYSVICAEDADFDPAGVSTVDLRPEIGEPLEEELQAFLESCAIWQVDELPATIDDPVHSEIPTLLLSGRFDPITPPHMAATTSASLANSFHLVDPTSSHGVAFLDACANSIMADFLNDPDSSPDESCLALLELPDVIPPDALTLPLIGSVNSLDIKTLKQTGIGAVLLAVILSGFIIWPGIYIVRALLDKRPEFSWQGKRTRLASRLLMLLFGGLALVFGIGLSAVIANALANETYGIAMAIPGSAAFLLWIPLLLAFLSMGSILLAILLWRQDGSGSVWGKIYYSILSACSIGLVILLALQDLLLPPL